jgi:hypothetical protein
MGALPHPDINIVPDISPAQQTVSKHLERLGIHFLSAGIGGQFADREIGRSGHPEKFSLATEQLSRSLDDPISRS